MIRILAGDFNLQIVILFSESNVENMGNIADILNKTSRIKYHYTRNNRKYQNKILDIIKACAACKSAIETIMYMPFFSTRIYSSGVWYSL